MRGEETSGEVARLEAVSLDYDPSNPEEEFDYFTKRLHREVIAPWLLGDRVLEMGCATGELTSLMSPLAREYDVVEGSERNIEATRKRVPRARFFQSLWEDFEPSDTYSDILLVCGLEHVERPVDTIRRALEWLAPGGRMHVVVPNAGSIHRGVGVEMGILETRTSLSESDVRIGHRRVYDIDSLITDIRSAGLEPMHWQGVFFKVVSNRQMLGWDWALIRALHLVGQRLPSHCSEVYVIATVQQ